MCMSWLTQIVNAHENAREFYSNTSWNIHGIQKHISFDQSILL